MDLVEEEDDVPRPARLVDNLLEPLLELAAILSAGDETRHIEGDDSLGLHFLRNLAAVYGLRKPFYDGSLSHSRLAYKDGVVLGAPREDLDYAL